MHVEHYDSDSRTVRVLQDEVKYREVPPSTDVEASYKYWTYVFEELKKRYDHMPRTKERQTVALERDRAQRHMNHFKGKLFG